MQFLKQAMWLSIPAWALAVLLTPFIIPDVRITYRHDVAINEIRNLRHVLSSEFPDADNVSLDEIVNSAVWKQNCFDDPWDNDYCLTIRHEQDLWSGNNPFHVYSLGENGSTNSNGNDADDINSWNYDRSSFYGPKAVARFKNDRLTNSISLWPFTFALLYLLLNCALAICRRFGT